VEQEVGSNLETRNFPLKLWEGLEALFIIHQRIKKKIGRFWDIAIDHLDKMKR
jgi:hypothetical protein